MDLQLEGKRAIVTGGSAGIGLKIARQLALEGVRTAVCSRDEQRAAQAIASLEPSCAEMLFPVQVQLRDPESIAGMVQNVVSEFGGVDILINSGAEVSGNIPENFASITDQFILDSFEDKFLGILRCCREVVPSMKKESFGRIVNIAGHTAREAGAIAAGARNAAVVNLTKALAIELGPFGITANAVHPFTTVTERLDSRLARMAERSGVSPEEHFERISTRTSIGRLVTAEEIAYLVTFLASPLSVSLTGEVLAATGGVGHSVYF
jgi:NAD(P)-dependent dehydrogenase (short-subunit alcohol dehydrogenase family)